MTTTKKLTDKALNKIKSGNSLEDYVIDYIVSNYNKPEDRLAFIEDLARHGCGSGMVSELIYYSDTEAFFKKYSEEIFEIASELEEATGETIAPPAGKDNKSNWYAWFGFEETTRNVAYKLGLEI